MTTLEARRLLRSRPSGRTIVLLALAAFVGPLAVYLWSSPLLPGREEAATAPDACAAVDQAAIDTLFTAAPEPEARAAGGSGDVSTCDWESPENHYPWQTLNVKVVRERRTAATSSTARAIHAMDSQVRATSGEDGGAAGQRLDGVGDDAWAVTRADRLATDIDVFARRANVWVHVDYNVVKLSPDNVDPAMLQDKVVEIASAALRQVELD